MKMAVIALLGLIVMGCTSPPARLLTASARSAETTSELECMVDCLGDGAETCASCADRCLQAVDGPQVASLK